MDIYSNAGRYLSQGSSLCGSLQLADDAAAPSQKHYCFLRSCKINKRHITLNRFGRGECSQRLNACPERLSCPIERRQFRLWFASMSVVSVRGSHNASICWRHFSLSSIIDLSSHLMSLSNCFFTIIICSSIGRPSVSKISKDETRNCSKSHRSSQPIKAISYLFI